MNKDTQKDVELESPSKWKLILSIIGPIILLLVGAIILNTLIGDPPISKEVKIMLVFVTIIGVVIILIGGYWYYDLSQQLIYSHDLLNRKLTNNLKEIQSKGSFEEKINDLNQQLSRQESQIQQKVDSVNTLNELRTKEFETTLNGTLEKTRINNESILQAVYASKEGFGLIGQNFSFITSVIEALLAVYSKSKAGEISEAEFQKDLIKLSSELGTKLGTLNTKIQFYYGRLSNLIAELKEFDESAKV